MSPGKAVGGERFDVVIVGGGVIGMACAEALTREPGLRVCIVEKGDLGRGASWAGGGLLSPLPPDQCPDAIRPLLEESLALYPEWCERLQRESGIDPEYWVCGGDYHKADGTHIEYPQMAQVRNPRLMKALAETLRRRRVTVLEQTAVAGWLISDNVLRGVRTARGNIGCERAVLAAGAWSSRLGVSGISPIKGQMLLLAAEPGTLPRPRIGDDVYLIPRRDGCILVGSTLEDCGFDCVPTPEVRVLLRERALRLWPALEALPLLAHWAGLRPHCKDEKPILGPSADCRGLFVATGHFRIGITLAPASAARIVDYLTF
ncbi:FAD-dependent oxidoreductase [Solimonas terrae]|uniref:FAD-dependent oxidoreductase n=1 Tax=Solimonas terrae TaxID=1396819 RepID=A0A6M2BUJ8_9GAMM|nr:FAD-dependent oxidoreductase [Solimonas terrae]